MQKRWDVLITLDVNSSGADLRRWEHFIEKREGVEDGSVAIDRKGGKLYLKLTVASDLLDYTVAKALRAALGAYRRSYRSMQFAGACMSLIEHVEIAKGALKAPSATKETE